MPDKVYVITGPTSGFGRRTALELAKHGTVVLVGRNATKLDDVRGSIEAGGGKALSVLCDLSDVTSVRRAVAQITELGLPITGVLNNAGIFPNRPGTNALGWDIAYATNHIGPFVFTEALVPHLEDGTQVVFIVSAVEDPERKAATMSGFRGARYISAEASARGEWKPGGSKLPGGDAYATSKQCNLATVLAFARETPRLRFNAIEPGFAPGTNLGRDAGLFLRLLSKYVLSPLAPLIKYWTNPGTAARMITRILTDESDTTGVYYDEKGQPMRGSAQVHDPEFNARVVAETRALLETVHV
ncbi:SDR family NAD(P)-dependent oxidoreductase [Streptomyces sp. Ag109_O5-10]|uniref:SDR family NAD(P)-dependent oxidoreductase n=1 Tax=Streptomyces sp. Ag109_O5-10 TaxID=1855349 RepID=UPI0008993B51|nr:SDR family NAD(P)-dependent oxidoreductase [Streptomyces sp. Ag109_O5-10]SEE23698.1 NAD(P)-dependent dehydrogenase, short-chain alcohol dehydrogenase family [Streptomyces sp. Ag109_O5-10]